MTDDSTPNLPILESLHETMTGEYHPQVRMSPRASSIGHPCERRLTYSILNPGDEQPPPPLRRWTFAEGHMHEAMLWKLLQDAGHIGKFHVLSNQQPIVVDEDVDGRRRVLMTGHTDGFICPNDTEDRFPLEIKSMSIFGWRKLSTIEDLLSSPWYYIRGYVDQMQAYLKGTGANRGVFLFKAKQTPAAKDCQGTPVPIKAIWVNRDEERIEAIMAKARRVMDCVESRTLPERIQYDEYVCKDCAFQHLCLPDIEREGAIVIDSVEAEQLIRRLEELAPAATEYAKLRKEFSAQMRGITEAVVGPFEVVGKEHRRAGYEVKETQFWQSRWKRWQLDPVEAGVTIEETAARGA